MRLFSYFSFLILTIFPHGHIFSSSISLEGEWRFRLDPMSQGLRERWFEQELTERVVLPGTTDLNGKGFALDRKTMTYLMEHSGRATEVQVLRTQWPGTHLASRADEAGHLVREMYYVGHAWYQREIEIPEEWADMRIRLRLERVLWKSTVWLDDRKVGEYDSLVKAHIYELGRLTPGTHRLTIRVDNGMVHNIGILGHSYGPETQTRWNGIVGAIELTANPQISLDRLQIFAASDRKSIRLQVDVENLSNSSAKASLVLEVRQEGRKDIRVHRKFSLSLPAGRLSFDHDLSIDGSIETWDEFNPVRYELTARIESNLGRHEITSSFGFRHIERTGRGILLNGRRIFLRGIVDCAVFPKTGHPPTTLEEWMTILGRVKAYGFNHVRFHTWCPPEAAFEAADRLGLYLAPETPFWVDNWTVATSSYPKLLGSDPEVVEYIRNECHRISEAYGNHPSFTFFSIGNEFGTSSDWKLVDQLLSELKERDPRRLYSATTARLTVAADDYWVTHSTGTQRTRGIGPPHTDWDFTGAVKSVQLPIIAHETGQRPVFPEFDALLPKFTGPLKPLNLIRLKRVLESSGRTPQVSDFTEASARFQYVQYKAEHEALHRTRELAGYQLLMLNDFTGQSEALVGILDPFWEEKGVVQLEEIRQWNAPSVLLARFPRYIWSDQEVFSAEVELSHFGPFPLKDVEVFWSLISDSGQALAQGRLEPVDVPIGALTRCGELTVPLVEGSGPAALTLRVATESITNQWPIWVYPASAAGSLRRDILTFDYFDEAVRNALSDGKDILFLGQGVENEKAARTGFASVYWSAGWWGNKHSSLGLLCNPAHPALALFPTAGHSDWQWYELTRNATTFLLDELPNDFRPIIQKVPDFHYSSPLGQLLEARAGSGRILICGYDLKTNLEERPTARQFRKSLIQYMESADFRPRHSLSFDQLNRLLANRELER